MGGAEAVLKRARDDFAAGQYRWVASVTSQLVFADPANKDARDLGADALEQLGYQSEAATWRNAYLLGAAELRGGVPRRQRGSTARMPNCSRASRSISPSISSACGSTRPRPRASTSWSTGPLPTSTRAM